MSETNKDSGCRNPEMVQKLANLVFYVGRLEQLASRQLVGPTEWAEAVSLARYAVDRVGECGDAPAPKYCACPEDKADEAAHV